MRGFFLFFVSCTSEVKVAEDTQVSVTQDKDGDGFDEGEDCDDTDPSVFPSATEICDGLDNNCDGEVDEGVAITLYADDDEDGFGSAEDTIEACDPPEGFVTTGTDCDDSEDTVYPAAEEVCDGLDNDCNEEIDEGLGIILYMDQDGDGFGDIEVEACAPEIGLVSVSGDCDDQNINIAPNAIEECDEIDNNCNGIIDEGVTTTFYLDGDTDGYGSEATPIEACSVPEGAVSNADDCNDVDSFIHPDAEEICDEIDNNCDGTIDEEGSINESTWYSDGDGDGYGDSEDALLSCVQPLNYVSNADDCNDGNNEVAPNQIELCNNGKDDNCDGQENEQGAIGGSIYYLDGDEDGYGDSSVSLESCSLPSGYTLDNTDCNDSDEDVYVGAPEICDGKDNNCNGASDENAGTPFYLDQDEDGFGDVAQSQIACSQPSGYVSSDTDCDDSNANISPSSAELCDGIDNDCDESIDESDAIDQSVWFVDGDGDGFGSSSQTSIACSLPIGFSSNSDDCEDGDVHISPDALEVCDGLDNDCDGLVDQGSGLSTQMYYRDVDGDGYGDVNNSTIDCIQPAGHVAVQGDCDDGNTDINPDEEDFCDGLDNDCSGQIDDDVAYFGLDELCALESCLDIKTQYSQAEDGVYWVDPDGLGAHEVYCDQTTDDGGWSLISVVRNDDPTQVIVDNSYCTSISPSNNCKGRMPDSAALLAREILVYDLGSNDYLVYEGFETNGAFGYFTMNKQLVYDSTCTGYGHTCGQLPDPNLFIAVTSGYAYSYNPPLYQWWRIGGWWVGATPNSGNISGRVHGSSYGSSHDLRNRSSSGTSTGLQSAGHQALYFR